ncbi:hypothetical protein PR001_g25352 [Phytophthora rubi]|uniref:Uncharacterized protein n=1 Tax=Phytophthora rubi TaxID=129364 RepID=A0A6A3I5I1_9STRA|nr:hypothetical protein PR001_g25352 [Phytophthora rubi]
MGAATPTTPILCSTATVLPVATPPPFVTAAADIMDAAVEPLAIPLDRKPSMCAAGATSPYIPIPVAAPAAATLAVSTDPCPSSF